ncbi:hypothetical protein A8B77_02825 [Erythrobacter sp. EhN03]|uniref:hypothetical protein n=1 Tax=Qipengyuania flava TaxID=192812 RepID=UPI0007F546AC|nr:hypothetical protein A8B77_02825 [Erythrobacter sp. EhN03]
MFDEDNPPDNSETLDALVAANIGAMNGIACLVIYLRKRNLMTKEELAGLQDMIAKPLDNSYLSNNRVAQGMSTQIATLFSNLS